MRQANPWDFVAGMLICLLIFLAVYLVIYILFLLNLQRTLNAVSPRNRELTPGLVWRRELVPHLRPGGPPGGGPPAGGDGARPRGLSAGDRHPRLLDHVLGA